MTPQLAEDIFAHALYQLCESGKATSFTCNLYYGTFQMVVKVNHPDHHGNCAILLKKHKEHSQHEHAGACFVNAIHQRLAEGEGVFVKAHGKRYEVWKERDMIHVRETSWFDYVKTKIRKWMENKNGRHTQKGT